MLKTIFTKPGSIDPVWQRQKAEQIYSDFLEDRKALQKKQGNEYEYYNLLTKSMLVELQYHNQDFLMFLDKNKIRFCK
jgi:hypothetical protein